MKRIKYTACIIAFAMLASSMSVLTAAAEDGFLPGDIDQDGYITGHDTALLSRYFWEDGFTLSEDQLSRADVTGDGVVDETDLSEIHANEAYPLGDFDLSGMVGISDAFCAASLAMGLYQDEADGSASYPLMENLTALNYNLLDVNADSKITMLDAYGALMFNSKYYCGFNVFCGDENCYYWHVARGGVSGDVDGDGVLTGHDAALITRYLYEDGGEFNGLSRVLNGDINGDGSIDQADADLIMERAIYAAGDIDKDGKPSNNGAFQALYYDSMMCVNNTILITSQETADAENTGHTVVYYSNEWNSYAIGRTDFYLLDADADGDVDCHDAQLLLLAVSRMSVGESYYSIVGRYDLQ